MKIKGNNFIYTLANTDNELHWNSDKLKVSNCLFYYSWFYNTDFDFIFRRNCSSCSCESYHHAAMYNPYNNPVDRMCVEEDTLSAIDEARDKGYAWVPRGLSDLEVGQIRKNLTVTKSFILCFR